MSSTITLAFILLISTAVLAQDQDCGPNEVYQSCGSACPDTCESIAKGDKQAPCTMNCVAGCFCSNGMVRQGSQCVSRDQCPQKPNQLREPGNGGSGASTLYTIGSQMTLIIGSIVFIFKNIA